jgi:uncharacterized membrane protein
MQELPKYIIITSLIIVTDVLWIFGNQKIYLDTIREVQRSDAVINYYYSVIAYVLVVFSILYISIPFTKIHVEKYDNAFEKLYKSLLYGGTVGLAVNGVYNFTSLAIYKNYTLYLAVIDTVWSTVLHTIMVYVYLLL